MLSRGRSPSRVTSCPSPRRGWVEDLDLDGALVAGEAAHELVVGHLAADQLVLAGQQHGVDERQPAAGRLEAGDEHVAVVGVGQTTDHRRGRADAEAPAARRIGQRREDRRAVEARPAQPLDAAVVADQRGRATVADERMVSELQPIPRPRL
jgi:hypothetical protein